MRISEIKRYYKTKSAACDAIGVKYQLFHQWENYGYVPLKHQFAFEKKTKKQLVACTIELMCASRKKYRQSLKESKNNTNETAKEAVKEIQL